MLEVVFASRNRHKFLEFESCFRKEARERSFADGDIKLVSPDRFSCSLENLEETGACYEENALIKAKAWADFAGMPALADDSGIEVRHLRNAPGIHSARIVPGTDADRNFWLLSQMDDVLDRSACFVACLVLAFPSTSLADSGVGRAYFAVEGRCRGRIALSVSGENGFGYDPVFIPDGYTETFARLGDEVKSRISHRAIAIHGLAQMIPSVLECLSVYNDE